MLARVYSSDKLLTVVTVAIAMWQAIVFAQIPTDLSPIEASERVTSRETRSCEDRQSPGLICETCELLSTCVRHSTGWVNIPVETCDNEKGFYCNARLGMCSNLTGPCHPFGSEGTFPCTSQGVFPDPYDCQRYHMCYFVGGALVSASVECGADKAFNAATGQCSLTVDHAICQQKQYQCESAGEAHPWPSNPNIFYICKATSNDDQRLLFPSLYRCADGEIFDGSHCRTTTLTTTYNPNNPTPTISTTTSTPGSSCNQVGLMQDPENCHSYYYCSGVNGSLKHHQCPDGTFFNKNTSSCVMGSC